MALIRVQADDKRYLSTECPSQRQLILNAGVKWWGKHPYQGHLTVHVPPDVSGDVTLGLSRQVVEGRHRWE